MKYVWTLCVQYLCVCVNLYKCVSTYVFGSQTAWTTFVCLCRNMYVGIHTVCISITNSFVIPMLIYTINSYTNTSRQLGMYTETSVHWMLIKPGQLWPNKPGRRGEMPDWWWHHLKRQAWWQRGSWSPFQSASHPAQSSPWLIHQRQASHRPGDRRQEKWDKLPPAYAHDWRMLQQGVIY